MKPHLQHLDLFSGIGMFGLAARWAGLETIAFSEVDPYANLVLSKNFPAIRNLGDIRKLCRRAYDCEQLDDDSGEVWCPRCEDTFSDCDCVGSDQFTDDYGFPDVVTAGVPCQGASVAGKGLGLADPRTGLWSEALRISVELRPTFLLVENVPGLRSRGADEILAGLGEAGYAAEPFVVAAKDVGARHTRSRVWIVAYDKTQRVEGLRPTWEQVAHTLAPAPLPLRGGDGQWQVEPDLRRTPDADPRWMDRLACIGNAIVPQIPVMFFDFMREVTRKQKLQTIIS